MDLTAGEGEFTFTDDTFIRVERDAETAAQLLREYLSPVMGLELPIERGGASDVPGIVFTTAGADPELGDEGYELRIAPKRVKILARGPAGFGWAVQTIRQILGPRIESGEQERGRRWVLPAGDIRDVPRFAWRGAMLDVARSFFPPDDVKRVIDLLALYKLNRFHLHLTDDQGWRLDIRKYPELTEIGAATAVGGGPGGFYTQEQYEDLVEYAGRRGVVVVPEIDMPGHTQAALASIPSLNCDGMPREVATEAVVLTSSLCVEREETYQFVADVLAELVELTPGPYIHFGGDEPGGTEPEAYQRFVTRVAEVVRFLGKQPIGWDEVGANLGLDATVQHWNNPDATRAAALGGASIVMSPASRAYLDMKYDESTPIGTSWAGFINTQTAYEWDPASHIPDLPPAAVLGLEAALWTGTVTSSEHIDTLEKVELMMLPRIPAYAELGWSSPEGKSWEGFGSRLSLHAPQWTASGRTFTRDPGVSWSDRAEIVGAPEP